MRTLARKVLITGASAGIGRATAYALVEQGAQVIGTGRRPFDPRDLSPQAGFRYLAGDLLDEKFRKTLVEAAQDIDILVNAAGFLKHAPFLESELTDWRTLFETNVLSVLALTQHVAKHMVKRGGGQIIMLTSTFAYEPPPTYTAAYAASKRALRTISEGLRAELACHGIQVCEVAPGYTETEIRRHIDHPDVINLHNSKSLSALTPREVAEAIVFAISNPTLDTIVVRQKASSRGGENDVRSQG